jgi:triosephosphate isomerase
MAGNWKMHIKHGAEKKLLADQVALAGPRSRLISDILLAPPFTSIEAQWQKRWPKVSGIIVAGQNVCWEEQGAFTGEISPLMLRNLGATAADCRSQ